MSFSTVDKNVYIAIIGDIKESKSIKERGKLQNRIIHILKTVNDNYANAIASKFLITLGDEFQGLLSSGEHLMNIIQFIKSEAQPAEIRFGIGIGSITTAINPDAALGADGPAYYMARKCIDNMKMAEGAKGRVCGNVQIKIDDHNHSQELSLNTIFNLMHCIEHDWTVKQRNIAYYALSHREKQTDIAKQFNVSQAYIQQVFSKTHFYAYRSALDSIQSILENIDLSF